LVWGIAVAHIIYDELVLRTSVSAANALRTPIIMRRRRNRIGPLAFGAPTQRILISMRKLLLGAQEIEKPLRRGRLRYEATFLV